MDKTFKVFVELQVDAADDKEAKMAVNAFMNRATSFPIKMSKRVVAHKILVVGE